MAELQEQGKVRYIGVSNFNASQMRRAQAIAPITSLQPPYSLINRAVEQETLPFCLQNNIGVIVYSPMQSGLLTGTMTPERVQNLPKSDWRTRHPEFKEPRLSRNMALANLLRAIGQRHDRAPGEVAIAWTLNNPAVTAAIVGARHPQQVDGIIGAADFRLNESELAEIQTFIEAHP